MGMVKICSNAASEGERRDLQGGFGGSGEDSKSTTVVSVA